jgi:hypothetical protein
MQSSKRKHSTCWGSRRNDVVGVSTYLSSRRSRVLLLYLVLLLLLLLGGQ